MEVLIDIGVGLIFLVLIGGLLCITVFRNYGSDEFLNKD